jgi:DNA-binding CsgD family transcriptional regulator
MLKGLERPEHLYALELDDLPKTIAAEVPPAQVEGSPLTPLLEREADLAALRALVDAARDGNGRVAAIEGSAGIGKTRLLAEARALGAGLGMQVLSARGGELEREFAFGLVRQLFEPLIATASAEERAELFAGAAGLAAPLFVEPGHAGPVGGDVSFSILHGLYWLAANAAVRRPTLLLVDDAHWGDAPSLRWLVFIVRRLEGLPLMLITGTRPPEQSEHPALVTELLTDPAAVTLRPYSLGLDSVAVLARDVFAVEPDPQFCEACRTATGGNPLYLRALLDTLAGEGLEPSKEACARIREVGPEPVARAVSLRLSRLPQEATALAQAAAVLGERGELELAGALAGLERRTAAEASTALARAELLRPGQELEFAHPVVRASIYEAIPPLERAEAHGRAARLLAEAGAEPQQIAAHLLLLPAAGDRFVTPVLRDAARQALARGASAAAVTYLRRALDEPPAAEELVDVLHELGLAELNVDAPASIEHLRETAELARGEPRFAEIALDCGRVLAVTANNADAIEVLTEVIERAGAERRDLAEEATGDLISATWWEPRFFANAEELLPQLHEDDLVGGLGSDVLRATLAQYEQRRLDRARSVGLAEEALQSGLLVHRSSHALFYALDALRAAGEAEAGLAAYEHALAAARQRGDLLNVGGLLSFRGWLLLENGDLRAAEADLREGIEFAAEHGALLHVMYCATFLADFLLEQGLVDEADAVLARVGLGEQVPEYFGFTFFLDARGKLRLAQRNVEAALRDFETLLGTSEKVELRNPALRPFRSNAAAALHVLGRDEEARALAAEELELARAWGAPRPIGLALRTLGVVEGDSAGEARLREAVEVLAPSPARLEHAKALVDLGASLRRRNSRSEARELLRQGAELAHHCGATPLLQRANEELAATGARPRKVVLTGLDSLTASERRVAHLAAEELSNKEIAQALFVTVKTVEVHLSNVYRKLGIGSRRQLGAALVADAPAPALSR